MERVARYAAERGLDVPDTGGARGGEAGRRPVEGGVGGNGGHGAPDPPLEAGGSETEEGVIHIDREARGPGEEGVPKPEDEPEFHPGTGERMEGWRRRAGKGAATEGCSKRKEGGSDPTATPTGKRLPNQNVTDVYGGEWVARHKKAFLRWLYSSGVSFHAFHNQAWKAYQQVLLGQPANSPRAVLPNHSKIASMWEVETHRAELAEELEEVRQPFWVTGATLLSDGRKSRDGRPIVNFLAAGSRGVVVYTTINREGEPDDAVHVLRRWVTIFHEFSFGGLQRVKAICTESASAYVGAARALASSSMPLALRRITWLPWDPWWQRVATIVHIMQPVMELLRRMDRGGQYMSLMIEWTEDLVRCVTNPCAPLGKSLADRIIRRVQARTQHLLEPAHCAGFLLKPRTQHVRYFSGQVDQYHAWLVGQAKRYILTQAGFKLEGADYILACRQFEDFHIQHGRFGDWGGVEGRARGRACSGDGETIECASWWSKFGSGALELQRCALRVMHIWSCASPTERNWAVHECIHTNKSNQLAFEKVVQLVEITANVRLTEYRRAGCVRQLRLRSPSSGILREEGALSAAAEVVDKAMPAVADAAIAASVDEIAAAVLEEMAASVLAGEAPATGGATALEGQVAAGGGATGGAAVEEEEAPSAAAVEGGCQDPSRLHASVECLRVHAPCLQREALHLESSGTEGLGMPRGSHREQTVAEASARVVMLRKGGGPVTIEEDDLDMDVVVREADEDYEGEEEGEEESRSGSDGDDGDDYDEPPPPPGPPSTSASTRSAARTSSSSRGRKRSTSDTRGGTRKQSGNGEEGSLTDEANTPLLPYSQCTSSCSAVLVFSVV
ncbi:hypothetical protein CBR_g37974 [Chara braunii]|uniref:DUF659 domain-containing protein n=1 Tax=Chara braunii TaxID=69332 RepID=A0A388LPB5_CHABU|nr:hypothetical protein CBR_g37974 [Chara braunii]|eukprot:GBG84099.1 hypothetical protein CBR_g37974 [Chara braunii]